MAELELSTAAQQWVNVTLVWVGFGVLVGLAAKLLIPGRHPSGTIGTLLIGAAGSVVGPLCLCFLLRRQALNPISPLGFLAAVAGALVLLVLYRLLAVLVFLGRKEG